MTRDNRQILINPHSSEAKVPVGALNLGEIGVQHDSVSGAALYVETVADSESASTLAKFITEDAINALLEGTQDNLQNEIDAINDAVGLPHSGTTGDTHHWDSASTVWDAIEETYDAMTAGTAAATTKIVESTDPESKKYLEITGQTDPDSSAVTYTIKVSGIDEAINSAYTILDTKIDDLSANTEAAISEAERVTSAALNDLNARINNLNSTGGTNEGKAVINVTEASGLTTPVFGDIEAAHVTIADAGALIEATTVEGALQEIAGKVAANEVESNDGSIIVTPGSGKTDLSVNIDNATIVLNDNNALVADLKISAITPSSANVKEEYALINHNGVQLGDSVKIYKDSSLYRVYLGHVDDTITSPTDPTVVPGSGDTALCFIYEKTDGTYELVAVDVESFLEESEFADGLQVDNHVVSVKIDAASEEVTIDSANTAPVLSVGPDGIKVDHIQDAIDYAVAELAGKTEQELDNVEASVGLNPDGTFTPDSAGTYTSAATNVREEISAIDTAVKEISEKLDAAEVIETGSTENWVSITVEPVAGQEGVTGITIDDSTLADELLDIRSAITDEISARETADAALYGSTASTSAETSLMGIKSLISQLATTLVKDVTTGTGETLINVTKVDEPEGDVYTISSSDRLNSAVTLAETSVQEVGFAAVATKDSSDYGSNAGVEIVDGSHGGKKINIDLSVLKIDCGEY